MGSLITIEWVDGESGRNWKVGNRRALDESGQAMYLSTRRGQYSSMLTVLGIDRERTFERI